METNLLGNPEISRESSNGWVTITYANGITLHEMEEEEYKRFNQKMAEKHDMSLEEYQQLLTDEEKNWCSCEDNHQATYHDDGESGLSDNHCWTCNNCNLLVQVG